MRQKAAATVASLAFGLFAVACGGDESEPAEASAAPRSSSPAVAIRAAERDRLKALVTGDLVAAGRLHTDDFELTTPTGDTLTKSQYLAAMQSGRLDYVVWDVISPIKVRVRGDKAVIRYRSKIGFAGNFGGTTEQAHEDA